MTDTNNNNQELPPDTKLLVIDHVEKILKKKISLLTIVSTIIITIGGFSLFKVIESTCVEHAQKFVEEKIAEEFDKQQKNIQQQYKISESKVSSYEKNLDIVMESIHDRGKKALRMYDKLILDVARSNIKVQTISNDTIKQINNILENTTEVSSKITSIESYVEDLGNNQDKIANIIKDDIYKKVKTELSKDVIVSLNKIKELASRLHKLDLPVGTIIPFSGTKDNLNDIISRGWMICDGSNGTPNLLSKFLYGGLLEDIGNTGGTVAHEHTGLTTPDNGPNFTHTGIGGSEGSKPKHMHNLEIGAESHIPPFYQVIFIIKTK